MREIQLTRGRVALVDDEDFERMSSFTWRYSTSHRYAQRRCGETTIYMHRDLLGAALGSVVDHVNSNRLDNRRANLRYCNLSENRRHSNKQRKACSSQYKGVHWDPRETCWRATIRCEGRTRHLGYFTDESDAGLAYDIAARERFGAFAGLNFPANATQVMPRCRQRSKTSRYRGVSLSSGGRWVATIGTEGKRCHLGSFATEEEAARAYDEAARRLHGNAAQINLAGASNAL